VQFRAQGERGVHDFIHLLPAFNGERDRHLRVLAGIDRYQIRDRPDEIRPDEHDLQVFPDMTAAEVSLSGKSGLSRNPSPVKKALDRSTSWTGRLMLVKEDKSGMVDYPIVSLI